MIITGSITPLCSCCGKRLHCYVKMGIDRLNSTFFGCEKCHEGMARPASTIIKEGEVNIFHEENGILVRKGLTK